MTSLVALVSLAVLGADAADVVAASGEPAAKASVVTVERAVERTVERAADSEAPKCSESEWRLDGAEYQAGPKVAFLDSWAKQLDAVVGCRAYAERLGLCFQVQGQFDTIPFNDAIVSAFGSAEAAQDARARARSASVLDYLRGQGVPDGSLTEISPGAEATFRGVAVQLAPGCGGGQGSVASQRQYAELIAKELEKLRASQMGPAELARAVAAELVAMRDPIAPSTRHRIYLDAGLGAATTWALGFSEGLQDYDDAVALNPSLRGGGAWHMEKFYVRGAVGLGLGVPAEDRLSLDAKLGAGYARSDALWVGGVASYAVATPSMGDPWVDRAWALGVEARHCLWSVSPDSSDASLGDVCIFESFSPLGAHYRRGEVADAGTLQLVDEQRRYAMRFEVGVMMRFGIYGDASTTPVH